MKIKKLYKLLKLILVKEFITGLIYNVAATTEHISILQSINKINTILDIGANKGQFSLTARHVFKDANIFSFEPLKNPIKKFIKLFNSDKKVTLFESAIGPKEEIVQMHVSNRDDSSSLLNIGKNQTTIFPGTKEKSTEEIKVAPLSHFLTKEELIKPVLVKIDVQGFELEVLKGSVELIHNFDFIYVECSFVELYEGQALASEVISFLDNYSFMLKGVYNTYYDKNKIAIQSDFLFQKLS